MMNYTLIKRVTIPLGLFVALAALHPVFSAEAPGKTARQQVEERLQTAASSPEALQAAIEQGRNHAIICAYCHGEDGNSTKPDIPNLAGQSPTYLLEQIDKFIDGSRVDFTRVMQRLSRNFKEEEKIALVTYYASVPLKPAAPTSQPNKTGQALYQARCKNCHGENGRNESGYAYIAGQQRTYVENVLKGFRDQKKNRTNPMMSAMTRDLSDKDILDLSEYIRSMK